MTKTLVDGISEWLNEGGYPLELYVTKVLKELGFFCSKSPFFSDAESEKPREIDIVASKSATNELKQTLFFRLVIECKKSVNAFVVLCDSSDEESMLERVVFGNLIANGRDDMFVAIPFFDAHKEEFSKIFPTPVLNTPCRRGYTLLQAHQKNDSNIYAEVYKLAKAYYYEIKREVEFRDKVIREDKDSSSRDEWMNYFYAHMPLLVIDAPLVEVYLDTQGDIKIEEKQFSSVKLRLPWKLFEEEHDPDEGLSIAIVTKSIFPDFAKDCVILAGEIATRQKAEGNLSFVAKRTKN
jgi:hypothetical protein